MKMADKQLTTDSIAFTEKKMDMTLDDIIKMEKKSSTGRRPRRQPIKGQSAKNGNKTQSNAKVQQFMNSRSSVRQGVLAQRRSNFRGDQFPVTTENARKAAVMPIRNKPAKWKKSRSGATPEEKKVARGNFGVKDKAINKQQPNTLDALFSNMKQQRMRLMSQQVIPDSGRQITQRDAPRRGGQWQGRGRSRTGGASGAPVGRSGNYNI